jgi:hypothetical protein
MKSRFLGFGLLCGLAMLPHLAAQDQEKGKDKKEPEKEDITAKVREMNSDKYAAQLGNSRRATSRKKELDAKAITKTDMGFVIQMPSAAPIPMPTVYKGKIYVSGGFSTKEYFCFDAADGKFVWGMNLDEIDTRLPSFSSTLSIFARMSFGVGDLSASILFSADLLRFQKSITRAAPGGSFSSAETTTTP